MNNFSQTTNTFVTRNKAFLFNERRDELLRRVPLDLGDGLRNGVHAIRFDSMPATSTLACAVSVQDPDQAVVVVRDGHVCEMQFVFQEDTGKNVEVHLIG